MIVAAVRAASGAIAGAARPAGPAPSPHRRDRRMAVAGRPTATGGHRWYIRRGLGAERLARRTIRCRAHYARDMAASGAAGALLSACAQGRATGRSTRPGGGTTPLVACSRLRAAAPSSSSRGWRSLGCRRRSWLGGGWPAVPRLLRRGGSRAPIFMTRTCRHHGYYRPSAPTHHGDGRAAPQSYDPPSQ